MTLEDGIKKLQEMTIEENKGNIILPKNKQNKIFLFNNKKRTFNSLFKENLEENQEFITCNTSKPELKTSETLSTELLKIKNLRVMKKILFEQLSILDQYKNDKMKNKLEEGLKILTEDQIQLRKCNIGVARAYLKKCTDEHNLDQQIKNISKNIEAKEESIKYYTNIGDKIKLQLDSLKSIYIL